MPFAEQHTNGDGRNAVIEAALDYLERGWSPMPLGGDTGKSPGINGKGWENLRFTAEEIPARFRGKNVGVLLGEPSRRVVRCRPRLSGSNRSSAPFPAKH